MSSNIPGVTVGLWQRMALRKQSGIISREQFWVALFWNIQEGCNMS